MDSDMSDVPPHGTSSGGDTYDNVDAMWQAVGKSKDTVTPESQDTNRDPWYGTSKSYWEDVPSTINGMLGGYGHLTGIDTKGSVKYLSAYIGPGGSLSDVNPLRALDCGAGIGRISKKVLVPLCDTVDLLEQNQAHLNKARTNIGSPKVENYICSGLQNCTLQDGRYHIIWIQWVVGYLTDIDLAHFFVKCKKALAPGGVIVMKESVTRDEQDFWLDDEDRNIVRSDRLFKQIFAKANMELLREENQGSFPSKIYPIKFYTLR